MVNDKNQCRFLLLPVSTGSPSSRDISTTAGPISYVHTLRCTQTTTINHHPASQVRIWSGYSWHIRASALHQNLARLEGVLPYLRNDKVNSILFKKKPGQDIKQKITETMSQPTCCRTGTSTCAVITSGKRKTHSNVQHNKEATRVFDPSCPSLPWCDQLGNSSALPGPYPARGENMSPGQ